MTRFKKYIIRCTICNKELEWYRGRPKKYCSKCLIIAQRKTALRNYYKNREIRLSYGKQYYKDNKEKVREYAEKCKKNGIEKTFVHFLIK